MQINSLEEEKYIVISKSSFLDGSYKHLLDDYIPVQKIKDKIEEIKAKMGKDCIALHEFQREAKIDVLQELLEKEKIK